MGTLYRKFCPVCDADTETNLTFDGFVAATATDSRRGGKIISEGYVAFIADSGELIPLPHPLESHSLEAAGGTWTDAAIHGRLLYINNLVCADCGTENTTASLHGEGTGCATGLMLAAITLACNIFLFNFHPIAEFILVGMAMCAPSMLIGRYVRIRYAGNVVPHQSNRCTRCGGSHLLSLASARKNSILCPRCRQKSMTIEIAGIS